MIRQYYSLRNDSGCAHMLRRTDMLKVDHGIGKGIDIENCNDRIKKILP